MDMKPGTTAMIWITQGSQPQDKADSAEVREERGKETHRQRNGESEANHS